MNSKSTKKIETTSALGALQHAVAKGHNPFAGAPIGMLAVDRAGSIVMTNDRLDDRFGYERHELIGQPVEILIPASLHVRHRELREAFGEYPSARRMGALQDVFGVSKDGRKIPVEVGLSTLEADDQTLLLAFVADLTERKKEEEKFRGVTEAASHGLLMVDPKGLITLANQLAHSMFDYEQDELIGQSIESLIPDRYRNRHGVYRASYGETASPRSMGRGRELFARKKDGSEFPVEVGLTPLVSNDRRFTVATVADITEQKRAEREIREKNRELSQLNEELTSFAYSASHDLKAPLKSIEGLTGLAMQDLDEGNTGSALECLERVHTESAKLAGLIEDLLALAKADRVEFESTDVDIAELVSKVFASLAPLAVKRDVALTSKVEPGLVARVPKVRLSQVLENLISNGIRYSGPSRSNRKVEVQGSVEEGCLNMAVEDNGIGIPDESRQHVFGMFQRFHSGFTDGSGLGLALTRKHVEAMGGEITFISLVEGTRFEFWTPLKTGVSDVEHGDGD